MLRFLQYAKRSAVLAAPAAALAVFIAGAAGAGARDPSFAPGAPIQGRRFAVADFNGDGKPDLAVTRSNAIAILLGDARGGFTPAAGSQVKTGTEPDLLSADFNSDGKPDLAVVSESGELTILLGDGSGRVAAAPGSPVKTAGGLRVVADFDRDGKPDLVFGSDKLTVLLADGSGRFTAAPGSPFAVGAVKPSHVAVADFDGDGTPDLAVGGGYDPKYLVILPGKGDGRFGAATKIPLPAKETFSLAVGDFNRDDKADLAVGSAYDYSVSILLGNGRGGLRRASHYPVFDYGPPSGIAVADLDGRGVPDLAVAGDGVAVLLGNGRGGFRPAAAPPLPTRAEQIGAADVNGDRKVDLVVSGAQGVTVLFQTRSVPTVAPSRKVSRPDVVFFTRGLISSLGADANVVATTSSCNQLTIWHVPGPKSTSFKTPVDGDCPGELALGAGQVAWISGGSGNTQEWDELRVASISGGKVRRVDEVVRSRSNLGKTLPGSYVGYLRGGGALLAYNRWFCSHTNPEFGGCDRIGKQRLVRIVGGRRVVVRRANDAYALSAVGGGRMAVASSGDVTVLSPNGSRIAKVAAPTREPTRAVALAATRLAVERTFALDLYNPANGKKTKSLPLGPAATFELAALSAKLALLRGSHGLVLVRLSDGKLISLPVQDAIGPTLTDAGLFYAYNTPKAAVKGHIVFEPTAKLLRRF